ncbi:hypothetical protein FTX61_02420 [Nitriliruptoraceae bacterium ZYF776]|nr:hypothetical protein [Profundirhabdus halotolerans]
MSDEHRPPDARLAELTGELPRFVRDAAGPPRPVGAPTDDAQTVAALEELGLDHDEAVAAVAEGRVALALASRVIGGDDAYRLEELAAASGVPAELLQRVRIASGLPVPDRFGEADLQWARLLAQLLEVLPPDVVIASARARGTALAMVVRADVGAVRDELLLPMRQAGADDLTVAVTMAQAARELDGLSRELLTITYGLHLRHQLSSELSSTLSRSDSPHVHLAVGFVDVVGWTALSSRIDPAGLEEVLDVFEARVVEIAAPRPEVSAVKFLGDAAMLVAPDAATLTEAMVELTTEVAELEDVPLRGGLAAGDCLVREGDIFGPPVNLAARLTDLARPWRLLADEAVGDELRDAGWSTRRLRPVRIRGVGTRRPLAVDAGSEGAVATR